MVKSSLWRTCVVALFIALVANIWLYRISSDDDVFANVVAALSALAAAGLLLSHWVRTATEPSLGIAFIVWVANAIEFAFQDGASADSKFRQCGFYIAFAIVAMGCWLSRRTREYGS